MLATTSRYSSKGLRDLSKSFAIVFSGEYISRGKKSFDELVSYARKKGHSRICVVSSDGVDFAIIDELGDWKWIDKRIKITRSRFDLKELSACSGLEGKDSKKLSELFGFEINEKAEENVVCEGNKICFPQKNPLLELEVNYETQMQHDC
jgi:hypothetical protein